VTVILIGNYLPDGQPSMQRFAANMATGLAAEGIKAIVIRPEIVWGRLAAKVPRLQKWAGYIDKLVILPQRLRKLATGSSAQGEPTIFHVCDHSNASYVRSLTSVPHVVTCHDLFAVRSALGEIPQHTTRWSGRQLQALITQGLRQAKKIVCDSEATRRDVLRLLQPDPERVSTALLSFNPLDWAPHSASTTGDWRDMVKRISGHSPNPALKRYVLHVGGESWYKNRHGVARIFSQVKAATAEGLGLVFVGPPLPAALQDFIASQPGMTECVITLQGVTDRELATLYRSSEALLFPSLDEGFGWPVLEAHACGCRVITSLRGSLPEVGGTAAYYIDPDDEAGAARVLEAVLTQTEDQRKQASQAALANAARFSLQATTRQYISIYEQLLHTQS